jgi:hypothetical protein
MKPGDYVSARVEIIAPVQVTDIFEGGTFAGNIIGNFAFGAEDIISDEKPAMELTEFHVQEFLHETSLVGKMFSDLEESDSFQEFFNRYPDVKVIAEAVSQNLFDLYQLLGVIRFGPDWVKEDLLE